MTGSLNIDRLRPGGASAPASASAWSSPPTSTASPASPRRRAASSRSPSCGFALAEALAIMGFVRCSSSCLSDRADAHARRHRARDSRTSRSATERAQPAGRRTASEFVMAAGRLRSAVLRALESVVPQLREDLRRAHRRDRGRHASRPRPAQTRPEAAAEQYRASSSPTPVHEAARIREEAREQGAAIIAEMREQAQAEAARHRRARAHADRGGAPARRSRSLRREVGALATSLAGRIVGESLDDEARQSRVVERFLADLESPSRSAPAGRGALMRGASPSRSTRLDRGLGSALEGGADAARSATTCSPSPTCCVAEPGLRRALTDPSAAAEAKRAWCAGIFGGQSRPDAARPAWPARSRRRWSSPRRPRRRARAPRGRRGAFAAPSRRARLDAVEDELFALRAAGRRPDPSCATRWSTRPARRADKRRAASTVCSTAGPHRRPSGWPSRSCAGPRPHGRPRRSTTYQQVAAERRSRLVATVRVAPRP